MWVTMKKIFKFIYKISLAIFFIGFGLMLFLLLFNQDLLVDSKIINFIAVVMAFISLPSIIDQIGNGINPKPKVYKVRAQCPKCRHSIQMDMKEDM